MSTFKKRVCLWDMCGVAAIILEDSDVIYYNQTGAQHVYTLKQKVFWYFLTMIHHLPHQSYHLNIN